ncbi:MULTISPECIES: FUSC family membrane protein [unclassified Mucilaginibacter]|uniref:FUSC family membrane protein n=1 Tax=unclassified Mucilaginibacter TaxID=2617802 RepID=UPI002AC94092|nr:MULTISPECIES: FUSC family membrane protein [unclassified Mucilaginibacter]MEB0261227.1 FUSC family membrane protein [Mucilaginibacter sp. 10I4]MEB0279051.1 FUSC family membrane protein [Mucilaginibacter sp. 10B2]MEB0299930.1 FUSC family membrane protein [Mucilaginibacter sp. 5C4]WPX22229.1 FUSC family membrane protein [Mucilaginibacter sp. 5C4]
MQSHKREIKSFFYSQYFSDGLRMTIGIITPALVLMYLGHFDLGLTLSLGALCICTIDGPGPVSHKRNAMAAGNGILLAVAIITGYARFNVFTLGLEITAFSFLFSMLTVYGNRAASVGTSALLVMIFMMDKAVPPPEIPYFSLTILAGGLWYMVFSLIFFGIRPYRAAQQILGENVADIARFLRIKADFYLTRTDVDENYRKLVMQQIQVSNHQDAVREILFKSRLMVKESTAASRILVITFNDLVDMFEQIMATHYDYNYIREKFESTGVLSEIADFLHHVADDLDNIGYAILANNRPEKLSNLELRLEHLKRRIDTIGADDKETSNLVLKKILINLRDLTKSISNIYKYYHSKASDSLVQSPNQVEYSKFVTHQDFAPHIFWDNLTFKSGAFKHALRVSLVCLVGFITAKNVSLGGHSYWVLLTIIVILKPGFSLSKQRNYQRLIGTIAGGAIGILILNFIPDKTAQFIILLVLMIGTYSFLRVNYIVSVIFMTPYVLILFKFLGLGTINIFQERVIDTLIGSGIAFMASYVLFPTWEFQQLNETLKSVVTANINYLQKILESISGKVVGITEYKLARKDLYVNSANLSAMFERMTSEPKSKQKSVKDVHKFVVLNHILASYSANIASALIRSEQVTPHKDMLKLVKKSIAVLKDTDRKLSGESVTPVEATPKTDFVPMPEAQPIPLTADDVFMKDQLGFINKMAVDIAKITDNILR